MKRMHAMHAVATVQRLAMQRMRAMHAVATVRPCVRCMPWPQCDLDMSQA
jgi:hypothetical protein